MKALIVSFYFPPAGGGGVQRPLKLAQYLPAMGIETHVLAPDDPRWLHRDDGLRVPTQAWVHRARYVGVSGGKPSEVLAGTQGVERALTQARLQLRRLVVPDENATWALTAIPAGIRLVREHGIDVVVSTSPPGSTHLIAAAIARATGIRWVADLRDSLVAHAHRRADTTATRAKAALHGRVARLVASRADAITCVSEAISEETRALAPRGRVVTIPNGADFDDVAGLERRPSERFRITHTGSFFGRRDPRPFLQALADSGLDVVARFLGDFRERRPRLGRGARRSATGSSCAPMRRGRSRSRCNGTRRRCCLLIPEAGGRGKGVLSGKVFEYVAVGRPILALVPPDGAAAELIRETGAGIVVPPDDQDAIVTALRELHERWRDGRPSRHRALRGMARPPLPAHARRGDGRRPARYARLTESRASPRDSRAATVRLAAIGCWLALALGIVVLRYPEAFHDANETARANAALDLVDRELGGGNSVLPDQAMILEARGRIPPDDGFQVAMGEPQPGWSRPHRDVRGDLRSLLPPPSTRRAGRRLDPLLRLRPRSVPGGRRGLGG